MFQTYFVTHKVRSGELPYVKDIFYSVSCRNVGFFFFSTLRKGQLILKVKRGHCEKNSTEGSRQSAPRAQCVYAQRRHGIWGEGGGALRKKTESKFVGYNIVI